MRAQIFVDLSPLPGGEPDEEWRVCVGWPEYGVSNYGRVRSFDRLVTCPDGRKRLHKGKLLLQQVWPKGHLVARLHRQGQRPRNVLVHRLVLSTFVSDPPPNHECCHNDGNPQNNHVSNLRWGTSRENTADRRLHGTMAVGERCGSARLTTTQVIEVRRLHAAGETMAAIARRMGVTGPAIEDIVKGRTWKHVPVEAR